MFEDAQDFIMKVIDPASWTRAVWRGTAFLHQEGFPPDLAFIFEREQPAREIFAGLRALVAPEDEEELLRISIIEGSFDGNPNAYAVNLGANFINVTRHFGYSDTEVQNERFFQQSRFLRMNPQSLEPLGDFKRRFQHLGSYRIIPLIIKAGIPAPIDELGIVKRELFFRRQSDITTNDEDAVALKTDSPER